MNKLTQIDRALRIKSVIVEIERELENPNLITIIRYPNDSFIGPTFYYYVAPRNGLFTADELQSFMMGLVPLKADNIYPFMQHGDKVQPPNIPNTLEYGWLYFNERIGELEVSVRGKISIKGKMVLSDRFAENLQDVKEKKPLEEKVTLAYNLGILVKLYPCVDIAIDSLNGLLDKSRIPLRDLDRYQRKLNA